MAPPGRRRFETTRWSLIDEAMGSDPAARQALAELCQAYWYPLYAEVRRRGYEAETAADLVQGFLVDLLERDGLRTLRPERGRFRAFLLAALGHFLAKARAAQSRIKRGGPDGPLSLDVTAAGRTVRFDLPDAQTPETLFDRDWALALLDRVFASVRADWAAGGNVTLFDTLKGSLLGESDHGSYRSLGASLAMTEGAVKMAIRRLKLQVRAQLRAAVAETVTDEAVDEEIRYLIRALSRAEP